MPRRRAPAHARASPRRRCRPSTASSARWRALGIALAAIAPARVDVPDRLLGGDALLPQPAGELGRRARRLPAGGERDARRPPTRCARASTSPSTSSPSAWAAAGGALVTLAGARRRRARRVAARRRGLGHGRASRGWSACCPTATWRCRCGFRSSLVPVGAALLGAAAVVAFAAGADRQGAGRRPCAPAIVERASSRPDAVRADPRRPGAGAADRHPGVRRPAAVRHRRRATPPKASWAASATSCSASSTPTCWCRSRCSR